MSIPKFQPKFPLRRLTMLPLPASIGQLVGIKSPTVKVQGTVSEKSALDDLYCTVNPKLGWHCAVSRFQM